MLGWCSGCTGVTHKQQIKCVRTMRCVTCCKRAREGEHRWRLGDRRVAKARAFLGVRPAPRVRREVGRPQLGLGQLHLERVAPADVEARLRGEAQLGELVVEVDTGLAGDLVGAVELAVGSLSTFLKALMLYSTLSATTPGRNETEKRWSNNNNNKMTSLMHLSLQSHWQPQAPGSTGTGRRMSSHVGVYSTMSESRPMMAMWTRNMDQYFTRSSSGHDDATRPSQPRSQPALTSNLEPGRSCLEASDKTSRLKKEQPRQGSAARTRAPSIPAGTSPRPTRRRRREPPSSKYPRCAVGCYSALGRRGCYRSGLFRRRRLCRVSFSVASGAATSRTARRVTAKRKTPASATK